MLFLAPGLIGTTVFFLLPFAETVRRSLTDALGKSFCGIENYRSVLANDAFRLAAKNTVRFICICLPLLLYLSLILARIYFRNIHTCTTHFPFSIST